MSTIRVVLHFEEDDNNSMQLYQILQNIKRGKRATVLADNIMANLAEHNLLSTFGSSPEAMASLLTALSTNYRMGIAPQPVSNSSAPPTQVQQTKKKPKKKLEDIAPVKTPRVVQQVAKPVTAEQQSVPVATDINQSEQESTVMSLTAEEYKNMELQDARDYLLNEIVKNEDQRIRLNAQWQSWDEEDLFEYFFNNCPLLPADHADLKTLIDSRLAEQGYKMEDEAL
nr:hypothetical protein [uncultured Butyrivibrio sp.]